nr:MAG TPA: hypothetical protein [Caudoviricetes sp.]
MVSKILVYKKYKYIVIFTTPLKASYSPICIRCTKTPSNLAIAPFLTKKCCRID